MSKILNFGSKNIEYWGTEDSKNILKKYKVQPMKTKCGLVSVSTPHKRSRFDFQGGVRVPVKCGTFITNYNQGTK